ncbi:Type IV leader peptidase family protein [Corynebacterium guangdongense]|nr:Type IV leader peptidase family protein [Corynebacterium guangdongense]
MVLLAWASMLVVSDLGRRRLPDALTLPPAATGVAVLALAEPSLLPAGLCWALLYLGLGVAGGGIGGGDVKLALSLGALLSALSGMSGVLMAVVASAAFSVAVMTLRGSASAAHGPSMIAAAVVVGVLAAFSRWG